MVNRVLKHLFFYSSVPVSIFCCPFSGTGAVFSHLLYLYIYFVIIIVQINGQFLTSGGLLISLPIGIQRNPRTNSRQFTQCQPQGRCIWGNRSWEEHTWTGWSERERTFLTEEIPGKEGKFQRLFQWQKRGLCSAGEEAHSRDRCSLGGNLTRATPQLMRGPVYLGVPWLTTSSL